MEMTGIVEPVREELAATKSILREALASDVDLVRELAQYLIGLKGKMLRPVMVLLSAKACGRVPEGALKAAAGLELIHVATLVHDDVVDESKMRRGMPSLHSIWSNRASILMGDYLLSHAFRLFVETGSLPTLDILARATVRLSNGAIHQIEQSATLETAEEVYLSVIRDKTASLFSAAAEMGSIGNGPDGEVRARMAAFGEHVGMAFQIMDDILDYEGREEEMGKPSGADLREKHLTLPLIHAMNTAPLAELDRARKMFEGNLTAEQWQHIRSFIHAHDGIGYSVRKAEEFAALAQCQLKCLDPSLAKDSLCHLAAYSVHRRE